MDDLRPSPPTEAAPLLVACLCARWCRTCESYEAIFREVRDDFAAAGDAAAPRFVWVDVEDEAELVGDLDIEDFPTLLIAQQGQVRFFGPLLPHAGTLARMVQGALDRALPAPPPGLPPDVLALPARLAAHAVV